ncbi:hypothetical protein CPB83DRAFT_859005 [Crepidotus variabilis]|uniref:VCBS repeat-containing protein n=1 Tax=Crepidotus variabilis TaxID=179855 RepID=A0A9P6EAV3_9AGAR|nr:hypothetical protein CPB83DRAFT_859005 [Crepidotus variabilis]
MTSQVFTQDQPTLILSQGFADIVGFGLNGVVIMRNAVDLKATTVIEDYSLNNGGWHIEKHPRLMADITGNQRADIVGFGEFGVLISYNNGDNTFGPQNMVLKDFAYTAGGWRVERHIRYAADIRNTGRCDIFGFGEKGVVVAQNNGDGTFRNAKIVLPEFGYNARWRIERHLRCLANVMGNGRLDIVGFGESHVFVAENKGDGTFASAKSVSDDFSYAAGWRIEQHPRLLADLNGDGKADIIGFRDDGVYVSRNSGWGRFGPTKKVISNFGTAQAWSVDKHPRFVADLTGDKRGDIIGFGDAGVWVALNRGDGTFQDARLALTDFGAERWSLPKHPRFVADLNGDGCADIIGFYDDGVWVAFNNGHGSFSPAQKITDEFGWNDGKWDPSTTLRLLANLGSSTRQ